jgi:hypothetical protein
MWVYIVGPVCAILEAFSASGELNETPLGKSGRPGIAAEAPAQRDIVAPPICGVSPIR